DRGTVVGEDLCDGVAHFAGLFHATSVQPGAACDRGVVHVVVVGAVIWYAVYEHFQLDHSEGGVVENDELHRQVVRLQCQQLAHEHRQSTVARHRDHLPAGGGQLRAD